MKILMRLFFFCALAISLCAQTSNEFFLLGNSAYEKGDSLRALENYTQAMKLGDKSAEIYFNTANACAKLNMPAKAQLYYLKALRANPRFREAAANLEILTKDSALDSIEKNHADYLFLELSKTEWLLIATASFWIAALLFLIAPLYGKRSPATILLTTFFALFTLVGATGVMRWNTFENRAVAVGENAELKISPTQNAPTSLVVEDGKIVKVLKKRGNFLLVETPSGKRGWASTNQFLLIEE